MRQNKEKNRVIMELFRVSRASMEAAEFILPLVRDEDLKSQIARQRERYQNAAEKARQTLLENGLEPEKESGLAERAMFHYLQMTTAWTRNTHHLAVLAISGSEAAMSDLTKKMNRSADETAEARRFAEEYLNAEQRNIDSLKKYL